MTSAPICKVEINYGVARAAPGNAVHHFTVEVVDVDGGRLIMWDGHDYGEAIKQAHHLSEDFGREVSDLVAGGEA